MRRRYKRRFPLMVIQYVIFSFGTVREFDLYVYLTSSTTSQHSVFDPNVELVEA
jgi:hypothetical protein